MGCLCPWNIAACPTCNLLMREGEGKESVRRINSTTQRLQKKREEGRDREKGGGEIGGKGKRKKWYRIEERRKQIKHVQCDSNLTGNMLRRENMSLKV